jgi:glycosyltransferase involved in cell wall biosynthesis
MVRRPRWIYASDLFSTPAALILSRLGLKVLYHEHDYAHSASGWVSQRLQLVRRRVAARCPCILPNEHRAALFREETCASQTIVVWNCPSIEEVPRFRTPRVATSLRLFYVGVIGPTMLPLNILAALEGMPANVQLVIVGYEAIGAESYRDEFLRIANSKGLRDRIEVHDAMSRSDFYPLAQACDVGLVLLPANSENINIRHLLGASNKAFDYLACGLALLATDTKEWRAFVEDAAIGRVCDPANPQTIAEQIKWFTERLDETRAMGERGRERVLADWNYEAQFKPVLQLLQAD